MRKLYPAVALSLVVAACSDAPTGPTNILETAPTVRLSHMDGAGASTTDDLCGGLSPCDAYDAYWHGAVGVPGFCFEPPMVNNHASDPACSAPSIPGLGGVFKLAWCKVTYTDPTGAAAPTIDYCQPQSDWKPLEEDGDRYSTSVRWRKNELLGNGERVQDGDVFRLYVVRGDQHFAHRDVVIDPNLTTPADGFVHAIGNGNEPVKVRITEAFTCVYYDTQEGTAENAATCLIAGETSFSFATNQVNTTFNFPNGNPSFFADFEVSECLSLGFDPNGSGGATGNALVDVPLAGCKISLSSEELAQLTIPGQIYVDLPAASPFHADARPNVLQYDEFGIGALPPSDDPGWFGTASSSSAMLRALDWGVQKLRGVAAFLGPQPLHAWPGSGWDFTRLSDFQVAWMPVMAHGNTGTACATPHPSCLDLGTFGGSTPVVPVTVDVTAPSASATPSQLAVPGTRLHVFPEHGSVACPTPAPANGQQCYAAGVPDNSTSPPSGWPHVVVVTGNDGKGSVSWTLAGGLSRLRVVACGAGRPGPNEPNPPAEPGADAVWGTLTAASCVSRNPLAAGYDNGPADGLTPFEPVDTQNEVAIYGLPLTFEARTCPVINPDGIKGTGEWDCATVIPFIAPLKGPKATSPNAWLYLYNDGTSPGDALYVGLEVLTTDRNKAYINLVEDANPAADDDVLVLDFPNSGPGTAQDWFYTQACTGNNASSLCGSPDTTGDGARSFVAAATSTGANGHVFYEFKRPFGANALQDLDAVTGQLIGVRISVTQGQGGGKGGFVYPDPQTGPTYYRYPLR